MAEASTSVPSAMVMTAVRGWRAFRGRQTAPAKPARRRGPADPGTCTCLFCLCNEIDRTAMAAHPSHLAGSTGCHWLLPAAEMADRAGGTWRPSPGPAAMGWACRARIAARALSAEAGSVRAARDFTIATLRRWGMVERSQDIAFVVSELLTNALQHALPGSGGTGPRGPVRLGLLQQGRWLLCAVADPGKRRRGRGRPVPWPRPAAGCR